MADIGMNDGTQSPVQVLGHRAGRSRAISSTDDSGVERLEVNAKITGTATAELSELDDEVAIFGGVDGSETADAATRQILNVDSAGRSRVVGAAASGSAVAGNPVLIAGSQSGTVRAIATNSAGQTLIDSPTAHDAGDSGSPHKIGGRARTTHVTAVAENDRSDAIFTTTGGQMVAGSDGTGPVNLRTDSTGNQGVYGKSSSAAFADAISNTQSFPIAENATLLTAVPYNYVYDTANNHWDRMRGNEVGSFVHGPTLHDGAPGTVRPVITGHVAIAHGDNPTAVAAADATVQYANRAGIPFVIGGHMNAITGEYNTTAAQTNDGILADVAAGTKYVITRISVTVDEATTVGVDFRIGFGTASVPAEGASGATAVSGVLLSHPGLIGGGGITIGDGSGILGIGGDGEELRITNSVPTGGKLVVTLTWYTIES